MIIVDIETRTENPKIVNPDKDEFLFLGAYDYDTGTYHFLTNHQEIKNLLKNHREIITFNGKYYDEPIMRRTGLWKHKHLHLDLYEIIKKRAMFLGCDNASKKLSSLAKHFKLEQNKQEDFDYSILQKTEWTSEELEYIKEYTLQDIRTTKVLWEHVNNFFLPFKEYLSDYNNKMFHYLTSSIASYTYKAICNLCGIEEEYADDIQRVPYKGGYVKQPDKEYYESIILLDFSSLYPFVMAQNHLLSPQIGGWTNHFFGIKGNYNTEQGLIEKTLMRLYRQRVEYKKVGDKREYVIKIILNGFYGMTANPVFKNVYNPTTASDCCSIARTCTKTAIKTFQKLGYEVAYCDTDSVFVVQKSEDDKETIKEIAKLIVKRLQAEMQTPEELFELKIDDEIKHLYFFKKNEEFLKKMYVYVNKKGKLVIKGLPIIKRDSTKVSKVVFDKVVKSLMMNGVSKIDYLTLKNAVYEELNNNIKLCLREFNVKPTSFYKNTSQLEHQISQKYGEGKHQLIMNHKVGVGKGSKYCTMKEFKDNNLTIYDLNLDKVWNELEFFTTLPVKTRKTKQRMNKSQGVLEQWIK